MISSPLTARRRSDHVLLEQPLQCDVYNVATGPFASSTLDQSSSDSTPIKGSGSCRTPVLNEWTSGGAMRS